MVIPATIDGLPVTRIGDEAFYFCTSLTSITIPNSVTSIGRFAFYYCGLTSVTMPRSVTSVETYAFGSCLNLIAINVDAANASYSSVNGVLFKNSQTALIQYPAGKVGSYAIPGSVTNIGVGAFIGATDVTLYYLPGTTGWDATFDDRPAVLWNPLVQTSAPGLGVGPAGFGFNITGTTNIPIVVEACTNVANPNWVAWQSLNLTNGAFYFTDPDWTDYPARYYRIRSP